MGISVINKQIKDNMLLFTTHGLTRKRTLSGKDWHVRLAVHLEQNTERNHKFNCYVRTPQSSIPKFFLSIMKKPTWNSWLSHGIQILSDSSLTHKHMQVNFWNENHIYTANLKTEVNSTDWKNWQLPRSPYRAIRMSSANCNCYRACAFQVKRPLILNAVSSINSYFSLEPSSFPNRVMPDKTPLQKICNVCIA